MKSSKGKQWRELAYHWSNLSDLYVGALQRTWLEVELIEDKPLADSLRQALVSGFIPDPGRQALDQEDDDDET